MPADSSAWGPTGLFTFLFQYKKPAVKPSLMNETLPPEDAIRQMPPSPYKHPEGEDRVLALTSNHWLVFKVGFALHQNNHSAPPGLSSSQDCKGERAHVHSLTSPRPSQLGIFMSPLY